MSWLRCSTSAQVSGLTCGAVASRPMACSCEFKPVDTCATLAWIH